MLTKKIVIPAVAVFVGGGLLIAGQMAYAQSNTNPISGLAQAIAQKFNLNQSDVQNTITFYRQSQFASRQQLMQDRLKTRLDQEVKNGKITSSQEQAMLDELTTLRNKYNPQSFKSMTPAQRKQAFQNEQSDLKSWAQSQHIDLSLIPFRLGTGRGFGRFGRKPMSSPTP